MPRPALIAGAFATVALVIVAGGCGFKSEPTGALNPAPVTVTDAEGATVSLDAVPKRIVSLDPGMTELLFEIGAGDSVVARSAGDAYPAAAADVPVVSPRPAAVRRYKPDLVIADEHSAQELRAALKVPVYAVDGTTITGAERDQLKVGLLAGRGPQGRTIAEQVRREDRPHPGCDRAAVPRQGLSRPRCVRAAEQARLPADRRRGRVGGHRRLTRRAEAHRPHGVPVRAGPRGYPQEVRTDPETKTLPATTRGRVRTIPLWWVTTDGPRMAQAVGRLAAVLHPSPGSGQ